MKKEIVLKQNFSS